MKIPPKRIAEIEALRLEIANHPDRNQWCKSGTGWDICVAVSELLAEREELIGENICDACAGTGKPISGKPCMCGGTGRMSDAAIYLREQWVLAETRAESAEKALGAVRVELHDLEKFICEAANVSETVDHYGYAAATKLRAKRDAILDAGKGE